MAGSRFALRIPTHRVRQRRDEWGTRAHSQLAVGGRVWVEFGRCCQMSSDRILVNVGAAGFEILGVLYEVVGKASLPNGALEVQAVGEATFNQVHDFGDCLAVRREEQMRVVGHDDEGVEFVVAHGAIVLKGFEQELGVTGDLE